ncbi:MAG: sigma-70 family RNA polymerase sigma factor, partial [Pyrinomonadaceae bacterium]|nr:sigma-70 family RNA polymerase sigma factor [Phycisphaerales bacterium]
RRSTHAAGSSAECAIGDENRSVKMPLGLPEATETNPATITALILEPAVQDMISAIADGNTSAFAVFYEQWFDRGVDLVSMLTRRDESFCLDVVQDAMVRAIKSLRPRLGIATRQDLDRWMTRVLHTTALDHLRRESRRKTRELRATSGLARANSPAPAPRGSVLPPGPTMQLLSLTSTDQSMAPTASLELDERINWIRQRLEEIDSLDRQLVVSHYGHARTVASAAASADMTPGAATGRMTRLINKLRTAAKEIFHDES